MPHYTDIWLEVMNATSRDEWIRVKITESGTVGARRMLCEKRVFVPSMSSLPEEVVGSAEVGGTIEVVAVPIAHPETLGTRTFMVSRGTRCQVSLVPHSFGPMTVAISCPV